MLWLIVLFVLYFLPSFIAWDRHGGLVILLVNVLLGWTVLGWIVCLIWALTAAPKGSAERQVKSGSWWDQPVFSPADERILDVYITVDDPPATLRNGEAVELAVAENGDYLVATERGTVGAIFAPDADKITFRARTYGAPRATIRKRWDGTIVTVRFGA